MCLREREREMFMYQSWAFGDAEYCSFKKPFLVDSVSSLFPPPPVPNPHQNASICKIQSMSVWPILIKADHAGGGPYWGIRQGHEMALQAGEHAH